MENTTPVLGAIDVYECIDENLNLGLSVYWCSSHLLRSELVVSSNCGGDWEGDRRGRVGVHCGEDDPLCGSSLMSARKLSNLSIV